METLRPAITFENITAIQSSFVPTMDSPRPKPTGDRGKLEQIIYDSSDKEKELVEIPRLIVPRAHIYGIKTLSEYQSSKRKRIKRAFLSYGEDPEALLRKSPLFTCAVPNEKSNSVSIAVVNGHHRARESAMFDVSQLPSEVCTPEQVTDIINEDEEYIDEFFDGRQITSEELIESLNQWMGDAIHSFSKIIPDYALPRPIPEAQTVEDLLGRFPTF